MARRRPHLQSYHHRSKRHLAHSSHDDTFPSSQPFAPAVQQFPGIPLSCHPKEKEKNRKEKREMEFGFRSSATCYAFPHKERVCTLGLKKRKRGEMCVLPFLPLIYLGPVLRAERCRQSGRKKEGRDSLDPFLLYFTL